MGLPPSVGRAIEDPQFKGTLTMFISVTRLRLRSLRFLPHFAILTFRARRQAQAAKGFGGGSLLADRRLTFWTITGWASAEDMRTYMMAGDHRAAMPKLVDWCDEACVVHWLQPEEQLPSWTTAYERMRREGRASKVRHPSPRHADMTFDAPRVAGSNSIPARREG
jgi:hypothetical protein